MRLSEFIQSPIQASTNTQWTLSDFMQKSQMEKVSYQSLGIEQLYFDWLRTAYAYRRMFIQDLFMLAYDVSEVRVALIHLKNEIFRKGFDKWIPNFVVKCENCGKEFQEKVEECDTCFEYAVHTEVEEKEETDPETGETRTVEKPVRKKIIKLDEMGNPIPSSVRPPDDDQKLYFEKMKKICNAYGQSLEDVLRMCEDDLNIADDCFIHLNKEYVFDDDGNLKLEKINEIRRLHPALIEFDLDKNGLVGNQHYICYAHRDSVRGEDGECEWCGKDLHPVFYIYNHRGKRIYLTQGEVIHVSKYSNSETYGFCYDDETQILTKSRGWKYFKELTGDDEVMTINPEDNILKYQKPIKIWSQHYTGDMYSIEDRSKKLLNLKVTPNHKLFAKVRGQDKFQLQAAEDVYHQEVEHRIGGGVWIGEEKEFFHLPSVSHQYANGNCEDEDNKEPDYNLMVCPALKINMDDWLEFLGYWVSEGEISAQEKSRVIKISQKMGTEKYHKIKACLSRLPFPYRYYGHRFFVEDFRVHNYLKPMQGCVNKYIPEEFKGLSTRQLEILFDAAILGDGHWRKYRHHGGYKSISNRLRDDMTEIAIKLGYSTGIWSYEKYGLDSDGVLFVKKDSVRLNTKGNRWLGRNWADNYVPYDGIIYCCEVPENHILAVRRRGRSCFSGNSPLLTIMQKVLTLSGMDRFLYRYFFERKAPSGMIMTYTDDPQSIERERSRVEAKLMDDPTYIPWIAVSQKTGRGKTDFIRVFHTLQEMDYIPVRKEIRDRVSAIYGFNDPWTGGSEGIGGISGQTQMMVVASRVTETGQKIYNERVFPILLEAMGITDWHIKLRTPEEKTEQSRIQFIQQKVGIANQMLQMGFTVDMVRGMGSTTEDLDFSFSGKAISPQAMLGGGGPPGAAPPGGGPPVPGATEEEAISTMEKSDGVPVGMHEHEGYPIHPIELRHDLDPRKRKVEDVHGTVSSVSDDDDEEYGDDEV